MAEIGNRKGYFYVRSVQRGRWAILGPDLYMLAPSESLAEAIVALLHERPQAATGHVRAYHEEREGAS